MPNLLQILDGGCQARHMHSDICRSIILKMDIKSIKAGETDNKKQAL